MIKNILRLLDDTEISAGEKQNALLSLSVTESVSAQNVLGYGDVCAAMLEAEALYNGDMSLLQQGSVVWWEQEVDGVRIPAGMFFLEKPELLGNARVRLTGFDVVRHLDKDITLQLQTLTYPIRLDMLASMVCSFCGVPYVEDNLLNGDYMVQSVRKGVTGRLLMQWIGQLGGRFFRANPDGTAQFDWYTPTDTVISPGGAEPAALAVTDSTLSISHKQARLRDNLQGEVAVNSDALKLSGDKLTASAEEALYAYDMVLSNYQTKKVTGVQIALGSGDSAYLYPELPEDTERYILPKNPLLSGAFYTFEPLITKLKAPLLNVSYTPGTLTLPANTKLSVGQIVQVTDKLGKQHTMYLMRRERRNDRDIYTCVGPANRSSQKPVGEWSKTDSLTQQEIFDRLTDGGLEQGIYMEGGKIYLNGEYMRTGTLMADLIKSGILMSQDGKSFYLDLNSGELKGKFTELSIAGQSVQDIAYQTVEDVDQGKIFNKLTNYGAIQGLFMKDGQLYINADYLATGFIRSADGKLQIDLSDGATQPKFNTGISTNGLTVRGDAFGADKVFSVDVVKAPTNTDGIKKTAYIGFHSVKGHTFGAINETFSNVGSVGGQLRLVNNTENRQVNVYAGKEEAGVAVYNGEEVAGVLRTLKSGESQVQTDIAKFTDLEARTFLGKTVAWVPNGDGSYSLIGV